MKLIKTTLSQLGKIIGGGTPNTKKSEYWCSNGIHWLTVADLSKQQTKYMKKGDRDITQLALAKSSARLMPKGTVLFSSRAPIGYVAIALNEICTSQGFKSIVPNEGLDSEYIYYLLKNNVEKIKKSSNGTTYDEISGTQLGNTEVFIFRDSKYSSNIVKILTLLDNQIINLTKINDNLFDCYLSVH